MVCKANAATMEMLEAEFVSMYLDERDPEGGPIQVPALKCLELSDTRAVAMILRWIVAQNLEVLRIKRPSTTICTVMEELWCLGDTYRDPWISWYSLPRPRAYTSPPPLRELCLVQCSLTKVSLIHVLASLPRLQVIQVTNSEFDINEELVT